MQFYCRLLTKHFVRNFLTIRKSFTVFLPSSKISAFIGRKSSSNSSMNIYLLQHCINFRRQIREENFLEEPGKGTRRRQKANFKLFRFNGMLKASIMASGRCCCLIYVPHILYLRLHKVEDGKQRRNVCVR